MIYTNLPNDEIKGKSVAIVGNAKSLFYYNYGNEIDNADVVIRFNKGFITDNNAQGTKTDFLFLACDLSYSEIQSYKPRYVINRSIKYKNKADYTFMQKYRFVLKQIIGSQPSTGFMAIHWCIKANAKQITLYGFDFGETPTFYNPVDYKTPHNYEKEKELVLGYKQAGLLTVKGA
ncbi:MAG: glycosyltransferase family 29 protein [Methanobrevibacter sp.]|nr:glycosyltransferase family 29 protein [Methanobrevibacter sp.]